MLLILERQLSGRRLAPERLQEEGGLQVERGAVVELEPDRRLVVPDDHLVGFFAIFPVVEEDLGVGLPLRAELYKLLDEPLGVEVNLSADLAERRRGGDQRVPVQRDEVPGQRLSQRR